MAERANAIETYASFGTLLKYLRRRARLTQADFAIAVGYSIGQICRLENDQRLPDLATVAACFIPALGLDDAPALAERLLELAQEARRETSTVHGSTAHSAVWVATPLPAIATPLIGRSDEITEIEALFNQGVRLVTLIGPPGVGKTRLAIAAAHRLATTLKLEVAFVDLAAIRDATRVPATIASALSIHEASGQTTLQLLMAVFHDRAPILLLDTMEQLVDAALSLADLLAACPTLRLIVTSRTALRIRAERSHVVQPLSLPINTDPNSVAQAPASALFIDRALAVGATFALTPVVAAQIAAICTRLSGLPLAIELAAARMRRFTPQQLLAQLTKQGALQLLNGDLRDLPARHRTLQVTIEWSYDLLSPAEQTLLARLAIFNTSWTTAAVAGICADDQTESPLLAEQLIDDLLAQLVEHNLVQQIQTTTTQPRFRLLEVVREFAQEQLQRGSSEHSLRYRHAMYYLALENQASALYSHGNADAFRTIHENFDNIRDALVWALKSGYIEAAANAVIGLGPFWTSRMPVAMQWLEEIITQAEQLRPSLRASVFAHIGIQSWEVFRNPLQARELCAMSLALYREAQDDHGIATVLAGLANIEMTIGQVDRQQTAVYLAESLELRRKLDDRDGIAEVLIAQGRLAGLYGHYQLAQAQIIKGLAIRQTLDAPLGVAVALFFQGWLAFRQGDYATTAAITHDRLVIEEAMGNPQGIADCTMWQGMAELWQGNLNTATTLLEIALKRMRTLSEPRHLPQILDACAHAAQLSGDLQRAKAYTEERIALLKVFGSRRGIAWANIQLAALALQGLAPAECANHLRAAQTVLVEAIDLYGPTHLFIDPAPYRHESGLIPLIEGWAAWALW